MKLYTSMVTLAVPNQVNYAGLSGDNRQWYVSAAIWYEDGRSSCHLTHSSGVCLVIADDPHHPHTIPTAFTLLSLLPPSFPSRQSVVYTLAGGWLRSLRSNVQRHQELGFVPWLVLACRVPGFTPRGWQQQYYIFSTTSLGEVASPSFGRLWIQININYGSRQLGGIK